MDQAKLEAILGRNEYKFDNGEFIEYYVDEKILITGGEGSLGYALRGWFDKYGIEYVSTDILTGQDVTNINYLSGSWGSVRPTVIFHLAAAKHAPEGEINVCETVEINIDGTNNLINNFPNAKIVLSSTCKAVKPETVYGATKLIAERAVLNAGGSVARYFNVVQSSGNVFEIWDNGWEPYFVSDCWRYFISIDEAVALTLFAGMNSGRYIIDPVHSRNMINICKEVYGDYIVVPRRRGDRVGEPLYGLNEEPVDINRFPIMKIENYND